MGQATDAFEYLARSGNRMAILRALDERPRTRRELEAETGVSRSTLSRTLRQLEEERGWIRRDGDTYETTVAGSLVVDRLVPLVETVEALGTLGDGIEYLPVEEMALDVRHFHDAEMTTPTEWDPTAAFEYGVDRMLESSTLRSVGRTVPPPYVRAIHEAVGAGELTVEIALDGEYLDAVRGSELEPLWGTVAASEDVRRYDAFTPYRLLVLDDVVHMWLCSDEGDQVGLLETDNGTVREWAQSVVDRHLAESEPLTPSLRA